MSGGGWDGGWSGDGLVMGWGGDGLVGLGWWWWGRLLAPIATILLELPSDSALLSEANANLGTYLSHLKS